MNTLAREQLSNELSLWFHVLSLKDDVANNLTALGDVRATVSILVDQVLRSRAWEQVRNLHDFTNYLTIGLVLELGIPHPWKICTGHLWLHPRIEEAVIALLESLVTLEEVHNVITDLWEKEIALRECFCLQQMLLIYGLS